MTDEALDTVFPGALVGEPAAEAEKPRIKWTVAPVGRALGSRLGGYGSGIVRREGRPRKGKAKS